MNKQEKLNQLKAQINKSLELMDHMTKQNNYHNLYGECHLISGWSLEIEELMFNEDAE